MTDITAPETENVFEVSGYDEEIKNRSDRWISYILPAFFCTGMLLALVYDTWNVALGIGLPLLGAYYVSKMALPDSN